MIKKGTTATVNFYVESDGAPATNKASSITAVMCIDGGEGSVISNAVITEIDSTNAPGWYRFNHLFDTAGNVFIIFICAGCNISPWEESVVDVPTAAENAAAALKLDVAAAQGEAAALSLATLILSQFNSSIDTDGRWTVYKTDGTVQTQRQVSTSDNAEPVTGIGAVDA